MKNAIIAVGAGIVIGVVVMALASRKSEPSADKLQKLTAIINNQTAIVAKQRRETVQAASLRLAGVLAARPRRPTSENRFTNNLISAG